VSEGIALKRQNASGQATSLSTSVLVWLSRYAAFSAVIITLLVAAIVVPAFFTAGNLRAVLIQTAILGIVVLGQTIALIGRGLDMSVSAVMTFSAVLVGASAATGDIAFLALQLAILVAAVSLANGLLVTWRRVPPFVATFALLIVVDGARLAYTRGQSAASAPEWAAAIGAGSLWGVPIAVLIWLALLAILFVALWLTTWGRWLYAVGSNRDSARHAGVAVNLVVMSTFLATALAAMLAGILQAGYVGYIDNTLGANYSLNSVAAAIIGGVAFSGGRGGVVGSAIGALLLTILVNLLVVMGLDLFWQRIVQGAVLVIAVIIQGLRSRAEQS
jgi:ribose/xylose/arabinose/galactoside ABC-type transport system permease subunit